MKNDILAIDQLKAKTILPFSIKQALIALELGSTDQSILEYTDFLSSKIPLTSAHFAHVIPYFDLSRALFDKNASGLIEQQPIKEDMIEIMKKKVEQTSLGKGKTHLAFDLLEGNPLEQVLKQVKEIKADLLVIGQKSQTNSHAILAKNLARKTNGNVLIIPEKASHQLNNILVPIDFSPSSVQALETALGIYKQMNGQAQISCLYVYSIPDFNTFRFDKPWIQMKEIVESNIDDAFNAFLNTYACQEQNCIKKAMIYKEKSDTGSLISEYADQFNTDLIIMGAKGHSKVHLLLMGSVTEKVINLNQSTPLLLVR